MSKYFIGNILSPTETQPEADDPTFAFTREETASLEMKGVPIRMEHHPDMEVGTIERSWGDSEGRMWVLGKLHNDGVQSKFAKYAIDKGASGTAYYTGLSLQHTHTQYASGKSIKTPVEVSLCVNPRRDDCRIALVDSMLNHDESEKVTYKILQHASNKMASETPVEQTQETTVVETPAPVETSAETKPESNEMSREEMMKVIIQQQKELEESQSNKSTEQQELEELKTMLKKQKDEEASKTLAAAKATAEDLVNQWAKNLDKTEMTDENKQSIMQMARDFPQQSMQLLRVAHCASKAHAAQIKKFNEFKDMSEKMQLQEKFEAVMQKKRPRAEPVVQQRVHAASTKKQKKNTENMALSIIQQYRASGSARDHMTAMSEYQTPKRRNTRATYY
jgi:hypothetical protein